MALKNKAFLAYIIEGASVEDALDETTTKISKEAVEIIEDEKTMLEHRIVEANEKIAGIDDVEVNPSMVAETLGLTYEDGFRDGYEAGCEGDEDEVNEISKNTLASYARISGKHATALNKEHDKVDSLIDSLSTVSHSGTNHLTGEHKDALHQIRKHLENKKQSLLAKSYQREHGQYKALKKLVKKANEEVDEVNEGSFDKEYDPILKKHGFKMYGTKSDGSKVYRHAGLGHQISINKHGSWKGADEEGTAAHSLERHIKSLKESIVNEVSIKLVKKVNEEVEQLDEAIHDKAPHNLNHNELLKVMHSAGYQTDDIGSSKFSGKHSSSGHAIYHVTFPDAETGHKVTGKVYVTHRSGKLVAERNHY